MRIQIQYQLPSLNTVSLYIPIYNIQIQKIFTNLQIPLQPTMDIESKQKQTQQPHFTFTKQLTHALKWIQQKDGIEAQIQHQPIISQSRIDGPLKNLNNNLVKHIQTRDFLIYAFIQSQNKIESILSIYYFSKARGQNENRQIPTLKGKITSLQFTYPIYSKKQNKLSQYQIKLVLGNSDGFIKIIDFSNKYQIQTFQIDTKAIVDIKIPNPQHFYNHQLCFALLQDYNIYVVSLRHKITIAHFRPTIMLCDSSLSLTLHHSMKYMLQTTQGGYIILWKINDNLFKKLQKQQKQPSTISPTSIHKIYNVFPTSILHAASVQGLIWSCFLGDLIAIITKKGIFKIIALNTDQKQQFATLLEYQIQNGHTITDAKLLPKQQCLIVVKQQGGYNTSIIECIFYSPELAVTNILRVRCQKIPDVQGFILSRNNKYILLRSKTKFLINLVSVFDDKIKQNKRVNDQFRSLTY